MRSHNLLLAASLITSMLGAPNPVQAQVASADRAATRPRESFAPGYVAELDSVVLAAGLRPLRLAALPAGHREIRLWVGGGIGWPQDLFRLTSADGRVTGQWIRYWYSRAPDSTEGSRIRFGEIIRYSSAGQCDAIRTLDDTEVCLTRLTKRPAWESLWEEIERNGVWTLPDEAELPPDDVMVLDGWMLTVEVRDGARYRAYNYSNPWAHKQPEAKRAVAIAQAFNSFGSLLPPSENTRVFRGLFASGPQRSEFTGCGATTPWGFQGNLGTASAWSNAAADDTLAHPIRRLYVEARGMMAYPGLAKEWESPYPEIVEVDTILVARPWRPEECD